eukprot:scaffold107630_cov34-Prasinocladus_malaysianus.AAC.1
MLSKGCAHSVHGLSLADGKWLGSFSVEGVSDLQKSLDVTNDDELALSLALEALLERELAGAPKCDSTGDKTRADASGGLAAALLG